MSIHLLVGTFRHPNIFTLALSTTTGELTFCAATPACGGHSWLHVSGRKLYCTVWSDDPTVAAYQLEGTKYPIPRLINTASIDHLSGYVSANAGAVFSASGPQVDALTLDETTGGFLDGKAKQSISLIGGGVNGVQKHEGQMAFGGLRHGGHSADLSPDGTKLYVADIGRNCVWVYSVSSDNTLTLIYQYHSMRSNDGPRHTWPHPNGRIVYCLQEHSSIIDVLEWEGEKLVWRQAGRLIPEDIDCSDFWADEVRLSPSCDALFGSTRGLNPSTKGYITSFPLSSAGYIIHRDDTISQSDKAYIHAPSHIHQTPTSGGWANAISACPILGPNGEVWLTLTDSEKGFVLSYGWTEKVGFVLRGEWICPQDTTEEADVVGASVVAWVPGWEGA